MSTPNNLSKLIKTAIEYGKQCQRYPAIHPNYHCFTAELHYQLLDGEVAFERYFLQFNTAGRLLRIWAYDDENRIASDNGITVCHSNWKGKDYFANLPTNWGTTSGSYLEEPISYSEFKVKYKKATAWSRFDWPTVSVSMISSNDITITEIPPLQPVKPLTRITRVAGGQVSYELVQAVN
jgi:hypothetical protein